MSKLVFIFILFTSSMAQAEFFSNISNIIENNNDRLSYGISVTDFDKDGIYEFIVAGFGYSNLALSYKNGKLINIIQDPLFIDEDRSTIGVSACDIDQDGFEEIYFLNTDTYSGEKKYSDRLLDNNNNKIFDYFELEKNLENLNLTAGRSVVCVDRNGSGKYGIYVANYGGPTRFYEIEENEVEDLAPNLGIDQITGGRAVISGHIVSDNMDIFAANERGPNFLYKNINGNSNDVAIEKMFKILFKMVVELL